MLHDEQKKRLEKLRYLPTKYEIALMHEDGRKFLAGFSARTTARCLLEFMEESGSEILEHTEMPDDFTFQLRPDLIILNGGWKFGKTGRTERQAIQEGDIPLLHSK